MKRTILIAITLLALLPDVAKGQWTFDIVSVEAYINDHKKQRSLLLARSTLEYSNQLLHEYSREETGKYKEVNIDLDRYTRAFDVIDVMYQSLRTVLNVKDTYSSVSDRIGDYKTMLEAFHEKILKHGNIEPSDALILTINEKAIRDIANEGEHLYKSVSDLVLYATGAAACSTSDLLMVLESVNKMKCASSMSVIPSAHMAAITIAAPARRSQARTSQPCSVCTPSIMAVFPST